MPEFEINDRKCNLQIERENDRISIASGDTKLVITYRPASFIYFYKGERITAVGDRLYTDIAVAQNAGSGSVLVLSGETDRAMVDAAERKPDYVLDSVKDLLDIL